MVEGQTESFICVVHSSSSCFPDGFPSYFDGSPHQTRQITQADEEEGW